MTTSDSKTDPYEPQQERSRQTERRIANAARELLRRKKFDEISVAEIARAAKISVGGFYARFPDKESLLDWFDQNLLNDYLQNESPDRFQGTLEEMVQAYIKEIAQFFRKNQQLLARIALSVRSGQNSEAMRRAREFNQAVHAPLISALMAHKDEIHRPNPERAIRLGLMAVSATLREAILFADRKLDDVKIRDNQLVLELTRFFVSYLRYPSNQIPETE